MKKIVGMFNINSTNAKDFQKTLEADVKKLQDDGQEVEIQYQVGAFPNGQIVLNALVIGRK